MQDDAQQMERTLFELAVDLVAWNLPAPLPGNSSIIPCCHATNKNLHMGCGASLSRVAPGSVCLSLIPHLRSGWSDEAGWEGWSTWRVWGEENTCGVVVGRPASMRLSGKPRLRWKINIRMFFFLGLIPNSAPHTHTRARARAPIKYAATPPNHCTPDTICSHTTEPTTTMYFNRLF
jgi:hypothetical protein